MFFSAPAVNSFTAVNITCYPRTTPSLYGAATILYCLPRHQSTLRSSSEQLWEFIADVFFTFLTICLSYHSTRLVHLASVVVPNSAPLQLRIPLCWFMECQQTTHGCRCSTCLNELWNAKISMTGLQEVRWIGAGKTAVGDADYTILWSGPEDYSSHQAGVGLAMDRTASRALKSWYPLTDRFLVAQFRHT